MGRVHCISKARPDEAMMKMFSIDAKTSNQGLNGRPRERIQ
jgi:hypothetical protein